MTDSLRDFDLDRLNFERSGTGLVTVVTQDARTGAVLMVAGADREALTRTIETGEMHYRSRTRGAWHKGETSGNVQRVVSLAVDCDGDAVLARVIPAGPACHTGQTTCFGESPPAALGVLAALESTIAERATADPGASYTRRLLEDRNLRLKKLGEETAELLTACADGDRAQAIAEAADLIYHTMVALRGLDAGLGDVCRELERRADTRDVGRRDVARDIGHRDVGHRDIGTSGGGTQPSTDRAEDRDAAC